MKCPICNSTMRGKRDLVRHLEIAHGKKATLALVVAIGLILGGCHSPAFNRLTNQEEPKSAHAAAFYTVSCCQDNDGHGNLSWPAFVPQAHRDFCRTVALANHNDEKIDGDIYLATHGDCGHGFHNIGDNYYPSTGY